MNAYEAMVQRNKDRDARAEMARYLSAREREDLAEKLIKAMHAGDMEPGALSRFDRDPIGVLETFLPHIKEKYGFPTFEVLSKSLAEPDGFLGTGVNREDISERLVVAVQKGVLTPSVLSAFDANPLKVLQTLPENVCKSFYIPRPGAAHERLSKSLDEEGLAAAVRELESVVGEENNRESRTVLRVPASQGRRGTGLYLRRTLAKIAAVPR